MCFCFICRSVFSKIMDEIGVGQAPWRALASVVSKVVNGLTLDTPENIFKLQSLLLIGFT